MKLLLLFSFVYFVQAQVVVPGKCPDVPSMQNLDISRASGIWYVYKDFPMEYDVDSICTEDHMTFVNETYLTGEFKYTNKTTNKRIAEPYIARKVEGATAAEFYAEFNIEGNAIKVNYNVIDTDYENYSITWFCTEDDDTSYRFAYVDTRSRQVSDQVLDKIVKVFDKYNMGASHLKTIDQTNCN